MSESAAVVDPGKVIAEVVVTSSTHLADFLATCGVKPQQILAGPERRPGDNAPVVKWCFHSSPKAEEIMLLWAKPPKDARDWDRLTPEEKGIVINFVTAFSDNLHHFISQAKRGGA